MHLDLTDEDLVAEHERLLDAMDASIAREVREHPTSATVEHLIAMGSRTEPWPHGSCTAPLG